MANNFTKEQMDKIEVDRIYTSWKQLCEESGIPYKNSSRSQSYQRMELFRYFDFEKIGRTYHILLKREFPELRITSTKSPYRHILQLLMLDLVSGKEDGKVCITQDKLFSILSLVNDDYSEYRKTIKTKKLSEELNIPAVTIDVFYSRHSSRFRDMIEGTLNSLSKQFLLTWGKTERMMCRDATTRELTDWDKRILLECKSTIAQLMGHEDEAEIYKSGKYEEFMRKVINEFNAEAEADVRYFYKTYDIIYNSDNQFIDKKKMKIVHRLEKDYKMELKSGLNNTVVTNIIENVKNRTNNLLFIDNEIKLTDRLIKK